MKTIIYNTISEMHEQNNYPPPENPLFSILHTKLEEDETRSCEDEENNEPVSLTSSFYSISLKNIISGEIVYGRTKYDCSNGTLLFSAPDQTMIFKQMVFSSEAFHIAFHKDYLIGSSLFEKIKKYNFFNYSVNEALHLSPKEEKLLKSIFRNIETEYHNNQDEFSREIILSQLETLLKYADRFYKRQFINRKELAGEMLTKFKNILDDYFKSGKFDEFGQPKIEDIANQLFVTPRYLSDALKNETGKTAIEHIHLYLIDEAKNLLLQPDSSISETAYKLGFEYPQYFSRLFKKKVGVSPTEYIEQFHKN